VLKIIGELLSTKFDQTPLSGSPIVTRPPAGRQWHFFMMKALETDFEKILSVGI
jgi:hypothetical protein